MANEILQIRNGATQKPERKYQRKSEQCSFMQPTELTATKRHQGSVKKK